ncbi:MAG: von Willebrand factor type [Frankiales bacterium]|nr:von Willebrand factor type [Frankiales bacterium]
MSSLSFLEPSRLWLLLGVAGLVVVYFWQQHRNRAIASRFTDAELRASVMPPSLSWRKHVTAALLLVSLTGMTAAWAKPTAQVKVAREKSTVVVAMDVSASMHATDVSPNRLAAAKSAATAFVSDLPGSITVGLVAFSNNATLVVPPTTNHQLVVDGLRALQVVGGTAIGDAVQASLNAISSATKAGVKPHIVLLSDGANTTGQSVSDAEAQAASAKVPVTTIAYGTDTGTVTVGDRTVPVPVDKAALQELASTTSGQYYDAASATELKAVYADISAKVGVKTVRHEITTSLAGIALLAGLAAGGASFLWGTRLV